MNVSSVTVVVGVIGLALVGLVACASSEDMLEDDPAPFVLEEDAPTESAQPAPEDLFRGHIDPVSMHDWVRGDYEYVVFHTFDEHVASKPWTSRYIDEHDYHKPADYSVRTEISHLWRLTNHDSPEQPTRHWWMDNDARIFVGVDGPFSTENELHLFEMRKWGHGDPEQYLQHFLHESFLVTTKGASFNFIEFRTYNQEANPAFQELLERAKARREAGNYENCVWCREPPQMLNLYFYFQTKKLGFRIPVGVFLNPENSIDNRIALWAKKD